MKKTPFLTKALADFDNIGLYPFSALSGDGAEAIEAAIHNAV